MKKFNKFVNLSLKTKLRFLWAPVIGIFILCFFLFNSALRLNVYENTLEVNRQNAALLCEALREVSESVSNSVYTLSISPSINGYINADNQYSTQFFVQSSDLLFNCALSNRFISNVGIIKINGEKILRNPYSFSVKEEDINSIFSQSRFQGIAGFYEMLLSNNLQNQVFLQPVCSNSGEFLGCIYAVLNQMSTERTLSSYSKSNFKYYILSKQGSFIFGNDYSMPNNLNSILHSPTDINGLIKLSDRYYMRSLIENPNFIIFTEAISITPYKNFNSIVSLTIIMGVILCFITFLIYFLINKQLAQRIYELNSFSQRIINGNLSSRFTPKYNDEISKLGNQLNEMADTLQIQTERIVTQSFGIKNAQLLALQNQMNPHFIYNTLESIRMLAVVKDEQDIAEMTMQLASLIRYSSKSNDGYALIKEEVSHMVTYLNLQKCKLKERLSFVLDIDANIMGEKTLRFFLQPLAENAIIHGIEPKRGNSTVWVIGKNLGDKTQFTILDDGVGIEKNKLCEIKAMLANKAMDQECISIKSNGIGIFNVNERCHLLFGEHCSLEIDSEEGKGTALKITIPKECEQVENTDC